MKYPCARRLPTRKIFAGKPRSSQRKLRRAALESAQAMGLPHRSLRKYGFLENMQGRRDEP
ncbi:MAG: hypothetical protein IJU37_06660 [Desulfovibrio sp.]|nr:hypothetical protein [Desulfovibrio sp.]